MGTPFLGELKIMSFNFAPKGWALSNGQLLPIHQNQALFSLFGTMYGGNGQTTFALPDLRGKVPIMFGSGFTQGQVSGEYAHTITISEMPAHIHFMQGQSANANAALPGTGMAVAPAHATGTGQPQVTTFGTGGPDRTFLPTALTNTGGSQPHNNIQPLLCLNICVALQGIFPSQT